MRSWMGTVTTAAAGGAVTTALLFASGAVQPRPEAPLLGEPPLAARGQLVALGGGEGRPSAREIYLAAAPAVVSVRARAVMDARSPFATGEAPSAASGFVIDAERGLIVCNARTIAGAAGLTVTLQDGTTVQGRILGRDDDTDLALIAVDPDGLDLHALELPASADVRVGDPALALGGAGGGPPTLTTGVVSATHKRLVGDGGTALDSVIQTDAPYAAADTGGPLLDAAGGVVGVTGRMMVAGAPVGFVVPADTVADVVPQLEATGRVRHAFLGVRPADAAGRGAGVASVRAGSPAAAAGLRRGDAIVALAGERTDSVDALCLALAEHRPGERVPVTISRAGRTLERVVRLADRPPGIPDR
ncbi:MAG TPA: trypsin-like peptidase domain-containing protein [Solirubrobacteraceae bacterium]|nr:trypsin-like peptidase domain-containing protein [Solirubrobacteraceae bacterium]